MKLYKFGAIIIPAILAATPAAAEVSGPRAELQAGYDNVSLDLSGVGLGKPNEGGFYYGAAIGYDYAVTSKFAIGIDLEASDSTAKYKETNGVESLRLSAGRDLYAGGRLTYGVTDQLNLYGKVGYTNARVKVTADDGVDRFSDSANADGVRFGGGAQYALTENFYVGAEYRYSDYEGGFSRNQVFSTVGYRF